MSLYNHQRVEKRWQKYWQKENSFAADNASPKPKFYCLDMFPYPSSNGLHVGHPEGYTATDIVSRFLRMKGYNVLHPMGWDAFGLPAENYAIKKGIHPQKITQANIKNFREQIQSLGFSYDWSREVDTSSPEYYKFTQWLFLEMYRHGLAYRKKAPVNWCPSCQTVLAREQVVEGACERCKSSVIQKDLEQWFFRITNYAEELLKDLETLDWPEKIKIMQKNWIGKSEGTEVEFRVKDRDMNIKVFTTRVDTLFSAAFLVLAPEHPWVEKIVAQEKKSEVDIYIERGKKKTDLERMHLNKEKTAVFTGSYALHPITQQPLPIWVGDFVLMGYGTGAIFGDAHDERDFEMAKKYHIPVTVSIRPQDEVLWKRVKKLEICYPDDGVLVNSGEFTGFSSAEAREKITLSLEKKKLGHRKIHYKIRDWLISRQRYWGAPIPIIYCETCGQVPVPERDLPVKLPADVDFRPTGESPLTRSKSFHKVKCPQCGKKAKRESDTMDTFVCSSWYFLRYADSQNKEVFASKEKIKKWCPVDLYVGGAEHAVMHLLYARFVVKALRDFGYIAFDEPFLKLRNQGLILGAEGEKMSKSKGNVVNPDEVVQMYGADTLRLYEMFMGPFEMEKPWNAESIRGMRRFLERVWSLRHGKKESSPLSRDEETMRHKTIKKVTEDIENFRFNTAISALMVYTNFLLEQKQVDTKDYELLLILLSPFAPHITEELWSRAGHAKSIGLESWPAWDSALLQDEMVTVVVQVNGKLRDQIQVPRDTAEGDVKETARTQNVEKHIAGKNIRNIIVVKNRLVNFVI